MYVSLFLFMLFYDWLLSDVVREFKKKCQVSVLYILTKEKHFPKTADQ